MPQRTPHTRADMQKGSLEPQALVRSLSSGPQGHRRRPGPRTRRIGQAGSRRPSKGRHILEPDTDSTILPQCECH